MTRKSHKPNNKLEGTFASQLGGCGIHVSKKKEKCPFFHLVLVGLLFIFGSFFICWSFNLHLWMVMLTITIHIWGLMSKYFLRFSDFFDDIILQLVTDLQTLLLELIRTFPAFCCFFETLSCYQIEKKLIFSVQAF